MLFSRSFCAYQFSQTSSICCHRFFDLQSSDWLILSVVWETRLSRMTVSSVWHCGLFFSALSVLLKDSPCFIYSSSVFMSWSWVVLMSGLQLMFWFFGVFSMRPKSLPLVSRRAPYLPIAYKRLVYWWLSFTNNSCNFFSSHLRGAPMVF